MRLQDELNSGGARTVLALLEDHFYFTNLGVFEFIFGAGNYMFIPGSVRLIDSGWVNLVNYGGFFYAIIFLFFLALLAFKAFYSRVYFSIWFLAGVWLNFKGLLLSPNAFFFILFIFLMNKFYKKYIL